jgi:hypothetical protein
MAASFMSPYIATDEIKLKDAETLLSETPHPIAMSTLERQCRKRGVVLVRHGRANYASWSEVLKVHRDWAASRS